MHPLVFRTVKALGLRPMARAVRIWLDHHTPAGKRHHRNLLQFYSRFLGPGDLCFDIGANVGDRAELFLELGARVVCVEPIADCVALIQRRYPNNDRLTVVNKAIAEKEGTAKFHVCSCNAQLSTFSTRWMSEGRHATDHKWDKTIQVPVTTMDALIAEHGVPRFCKIDVEGGEEAVLNGLSRPLPCLSLEFHRELLEDTRKCLDRLVAIGSTCFNCTTFDSFEMCMPHWTDADSIYQYLGSLEADGWGDIYIRFMETAP